MPDLIEITNQERARLRRLGETYPDRTYPDPFSGGSFLRSLADRKPVSAGERGDLIEITNQERNRLRMLGETYPDPFFGGSLLLSLADRKPATLDQGGSTEGER